MNKHLRKGTYLALRVVLGGEVVHGDPHRGVGGLVDWGGGLHDE